MITQQYINGYKDSLDNIRSFVENFLVHTSEELSEGHITKEKYDAQVEAYNDVIELVEQVKENYKVLIKNENERNKD